MRRRRLVSGSGSEVTPSKMRRTKFERVSWGRRGSDVQRDR
jgi:hypothetical protein